eukprot:g566.t1
MRIMIWVFLLLFLSNTYATEWDCTGASNTGTFQRSTDCTISVTVNVNDRTYYGGGVVVTNTLEIVGTVEDMNNLIVITAQSNQRHFYINGVNHKLILRYVQLSAGNGGGNLVWGGSILIGNNGGKLTIYFTILSNNKVKDANGGAISTDFDQTKNAMINIYNSTIEDNGGGYGGGCIYVRLGTINIVDSIIRRCQAQDGNGGCIAVGSSTMNIVNSVINNCRAISSPARGNGGGLSIENDAKVTIRETSFIGNYAAAKGDDIYVAGSATISIINTLFDEKNSGASIYEVGALATWHTCHSNPCTEAPFTSSCAAVDATRQHLGVYCHCNNCIKCPRGSIQIITGQIIKCKFCPANYYTKDGLECKPCTGGLTSPPGSPKCYDIDNMLQNVRSLGEQQGGIIKAVALSNAKSEEVKQKANGLVAKLSLDWATQDVINEAQRLRNQLATLPEYNVKHHCEQEKQRLAYGVLRTGVIVPTDAEIDDKYCLNENRDRLISSFCNFRPRFIKLLEEKLYPRLPSIPKYTGRDLWPNICCRKDNFQHLKTCNDPSGKVPRSHIVPFALAQGGNITVDNLYGEIVDVLKKDGYLQAGMNKAVEGIKDGDKLQQKVNNLFETTLLCGPREFGLPTNEAIRLCELFYPYEHMLATYYNE